MANKNTKKVAKALCKEVKKQKRSTEDYINEKVAQRLLETIITNIMVSFGPETAHGKEVKAINDYQRSREKKEKEESKDGSYTRHHRQKLPYHRSGTLLEAIHVDIVDGEVILVIDKIPYEDETGQRKTERTALDVYWYLNDGTHGSKKVYPFREIKGVKSKNGNQRYLFTNPPKIKARRFHETTQEEVAKYQQELLKQKAEGTFRVRNRDKKGAK